MSKELSEDTREADPEYAALGTHIRAVRIGRDWTLDALATATGLSAGYLSQVENNEAVPSIATLAGIAAALGTGLDAFFPLNPSSDNYVSRADDPERLRLSSNSVSEYIALSPRGQKLDFDALIGRYAPGARVGPEPQFGERLAYVLRGTIALRIGAEEHVLSAGDCAHFSSHPDQTHEVISAEAAEILWLNSPGIL